MAKNERTQNVEARVTADHEEIMKWAQERGGRPAVVKGTGRDEEGSGILRIDFGEPEENLEIIDWDRFFQIFEGRNLSFLFQEKAANGKTSRFFKFIKRE